MVTNVSETNDQVPVAFWSIKVDRVLAELKSSEQGLSRQSAGQRLIKYGANSLKQQQQNNKLFLLLNQFKSPIILILIAAATISGFLGDTIDTTIILSIVLISGLLGFWQEQGATDAVAKLLAMVQVKAKVLRDGQSQNIPNADVVPGDIVLLAAGDSVPGDCLIVEIGRAHV